MFGFGKKTISTESYKGVRDFYPEDMAIQNHIFGVWRDVATESGFVEYGASILESAELYKSKTSEEIVNEQTFSFTDRGGREVVLRPEMTPTLARMVAAKSRSLTFPLRWFSIPNVFRYERPQRGRKREHWQLNCDIVGIAGIEAEIEIIELAYKIMKRFGAVESDFEIQINDRGLFNEIFDEIDGLSDDTRREVIRLVDKQDKIENFESELERNMGKEKAQKFLELLENKKSTKNLLELLEKLKERGINNARINTNIARGFDYYTGMVFEVFDTNPENKRSIFGGGRYDNLLEIFGVEPVPTVGFGMGDVTIRDFLETHNLPTSAK